MTHNDRPRLTLIVLAALLLAIVTPAIARAQSSGSIAGVLKDTSGAVLPGVTVEASSPALIEKVRSVVTDSQGLYQIVDLRPGTYTVTFSLAGFSTLKRDSIVLTSNFTAQVNADMHIGAIEETIVVSGAAPVVDIHNVVGSRVVTHEAIAALPTERSFASVAAALPSVTQSGGSMALSEKASLTVHGSRSNDMMQQLDGLTFGTHNLNGSSTGSTVNPGEVQEYSYEVSAVSADTETGGVRINIIPREGSNTWSGMFFAGYANKSMQSDNLTDSLRARGLGVGSALLKWWDVNGAFGGPIKQDKLWFWGSARYQGQEQTVAGMYYPKDPKAFVYVPDLNRQVVNDNSVWNGGIRLTWLATQKQRVAFYYQDQDNHYFYGISATRTPEASARLTLPTMRTIQGTWKWPVTNRLLVDAAAFLVTHETQKDLVPGVTEDMYGAVDQGTGYNLRSYISSPTNALGYSLLTQYTNSYRGSLAYITGTHALKGGINLLTGSRPATYRNLSDMSVRLRNGVPNQVTIYTTPWIFNENLNASLGLYVQDQWTVKRLTVNAAIRFDYLNESVPVQHQPAKRYVGALDYPAVSNVPSWMDLEPRLGAAYDLFGNGKTAVKVSLSRYLQQERLDFAKANNPLVASVNSASRAWTDSNGNFFPDCDLRATAANGECGALPNALLGSPTITTRYDDALKECFGCRIGSWETSVGVQHELLKGVSVNAAYYRRHYVNFTVTDNLAVTPADYSTYCITAPADARLPGGGRYQLCGLADVNPAKFGLVDNIVTSADKFGKQSEVYDGFDFSSTARLPHGGSLTMGVTAGRTATDNCFAVDSPQQLLFCSVTPPLQSQGVVSGSIVLPWNFNVGVIFKSAPGPEITATYAATLAEIRPSLGRPLSGSATTATVPLISPGTLFGERSNQVDVRLSRVFRLGGSKRVSPNIDLYNLLNASPVLSQNNTFGVNWQRPSTILSGRLIKLTVQMDF